MQQVTDRPSACGYLLLAVLGSLLSLGCGRGPETRENLRDRAPEGVRSYQASEPGVSPERLAGDWVLSSDSRHVVVGSATGAEERRGAIVAFGVPGSEEADLLTLQSALFVVGAEEVPFVVTGVRHLKLGSRPAILVEGHIRSGAKRLGVERVVTLADVEGVFTILTTVKTSRYLELVERTRWGGGRPFVPRHQAPEENDLPNVPWLGMQSTSWSALVSFGGQNAKLRGTFRAHGPHRKLRYTDLRVAGQQVQGERRWRTHIVLAQGGLEVALRRLGWAAGRPYPEAMVSLPMLGQHVQIRALFADDAPWLATQTATDQVKVVLPLPHGSTNMRVGASLFGRSAQSPTALVEKQKVHLHMPKTGRVLVQIKDRASGAPLPARIRFRGIESTADPDLGPNWEATGARDVATSLSGAIALDLPVGRYEVIASRGPEWSLEKKKITIDGESERSVRFSLGRQVDPGRWVASDFHLHSAPSTDSRVSLSDRVQALVAEGISFAVPTDHNHVTDLSPTVKELAVEGFHTVPGVEVTTWEPQFGHFNAFPFPHDHSHPTGGAPNYQGHTPQRLFSEIRKAATDALIQVNHPRLEPFGIGYFDVTEFDATTGKRGAAYSDDYDVIELWNGFDLARMANVERNLWEWRSMLQRGERKIATGNSDSHTVRTEWAGYPRTYIQAPEGEAASAENLLAALRQGNAFVTNGPLLFASLENRGPGQTVEVSRGRVTLSIEVRFPRWLEVTEADVFVGLSRVKKVRLDDAKPLSAPNGGQRIIKRVRLQLEPPTFVVVTVRGEKSMGELFVRDDIKPFAFTNPIWVSP